MKNFSKEAVWGTIVETLMRLGVAFDVSPIEVGETVPNGEVIVRIYFDKLAETHDERTKILAEVEKDLKKEFGPIWYKDQFWFYDQAKYFFIKPPKSSKD